MPAAGVTVVAVDTSLSMSAPAAWAEARRAGRAAAIDAAPGRSRRRRGLRRPRPSSPCAPTANRAEARAVSRDADARRRRHPLRRRRRRRRRRAGRVARPHRGRHRPAADGHGGGDAVEPCPTASTCRWPRASPAAGGNLAVTALAREPTALTAVVQSYAHGPAHGDGAAARGREGLRSARVELAPLASADVRFAGPLPTAGVAEVADRRSRRLRRRQPPVSWRSIAARRRRVARADRRSAGVGAHRACTCSARSKRRRPARRRGHGDRRPRVARRHGRAPIRRRHRRRRHAHARPRAGRAGLASYLRDGGRVFLSLGPDVDVPTLSDVLGLAVRLAPEPVVAAGDEAAHRRRPTAGIRCCGGWPARRRRWAACRSSAIAACSTNGVGRAGAFRRRRTGPGRARGGARHAAAVRLRPRQSLEPLPARAELRAVHGRDRRAT